MSEVLVIEGIQIERIEYNGQPVLSLPMVEKLHQRPKGTAKRNFGQNRKKFAEGVDFYELGYEIWSVLVGRISSHQGGDSSHQNSVKKGHKGNMIFLTLRGYMKLATSFTDDLSWKIRDMLVDSYFRLRELLSKAGDIEALKAKAEKADMWQGRYITLLEEHVSIYKHKLTKKPALTTEQLDKIKKMASEGCSYTEIGRAVGRTAGTIHYILKREGIIKKAKKWLRL